MASGASRTPRVHWSLEQAVLGLTLLGGLPATVALAWIVWGENYSFEVRWTLAAVVIVVWIGCGAAAYRMVTRVLYLAANLLGALHEGDYSIRGDRREAGKRRRPGDEGDQLARRHAAAAAIGGGGIDGAAHERDGRDRRRGLRLRHGREAGAHQPGGRATARTSRPPSLVGPPWRARRCGSSAI